MNEIYLDHNATTPLDPRVGQAMLDCERAFPANPSSQHAAGRRAKLALDEASETIARLLGLRLEGPHSDRLVFTSGGTEANNLALLGLAGPEPGPVLISAIEHPSVLGPAAELARRGYQVETLAVDRLGCVDLEQLRDRLGDDTRLVSMQLANHETGALQPVAEAAKLCAARRIPLHTDAVQAVGKIPVDFAALGVSALSAAAHKFCGPRGIGLLALAHGVDPRPQLFGGFQQEGRRPGTESLALVVGMATALELWQRQAAEQRQSLAAMRDALENRLRTLPGTVVHAAATPRLPQTLNVSFPGINRQALLMALDLAGVACSTGSACASGSSEPSPVLRAMGCEPELLESAMRFSLGAATRPEEVRQAADRILNVCNDLRAREQAKKRGRATRSPGGDLL